MQYDRISISGLVVEYIVAIDVTRVRFPADALCHCWGDGFANNERGFDNSDRTAFGTVPLFHTQTCEEHPGFRHHLGPPSTAPSRLVNPYLTI